MSRMGKEIVDEFRLLGHLILGILIIPVAAVIGFLDYLEAKRHSRRNE